MSFLSFVGGCFAIYMLAYAGILLVSDCDVRLFFASVFQKRRLESFRGKVVWITGASSGIGEHLAVGLAKFGAKLVLSARNEVELGRVRHKCIENGCNPEDVFILPMDVTNVKKHQQYFDTVLQHFTKLDILINNAGRSQRAIWEDIELGVDREMFELNAFAVISLSRIAGKYFLSKNEGHLVVTSSIAGLIPAPFSATYSATKFAVHGYFGSFVKEKPSSNVKITLLCPGPVFSNVLQSSFTNKVGENFGQSHNAKDPRMATERCAYLSLIAISNGLYEAWIAKFPLVLITYFFVYCPNLSQWMFKRVGAKFAQRIRDNRITVETSR